MPARRSAPFTRGAHDLDEVYASCGANGDAIAPHNGRCRNLGEPAVPASRATTMDAKTGSNLKTGKLTIGDKNWSFPMYEGTIGPDVLDISKLYNEAGIFTYDPGLPSTGSSESKT